MIKKIIFCAVFLNSILITAQTDESMIKKSIDTFFEGFHSGDTALIKTVLHDKLIMHTALKSKTGDVDVQTESPEKFLRIIANRPLDQKWDERILSFNIQIDDYMANAWLPYEFWLNDTFSHCGANSIQMVKVGSQWKIIHIVDSRRRYDCD